MPLDIALSYDPVLSRCDIVFDGRDVVLDATPATPMLMALLCDRRAHADDVLPQEEGPALAPISLMARRGWPGDALDPQGRRTGSRLWLLSRAKWLEQTRRLGEDIAAEALGQVEQDLGIDIALTVTLPSRGRMQIQAAAAGTVVTVHRTTAG
jgi:phage gp46-like protein